MDSRFKWLFAWIQMPTIYNVCITKWANKSIPIWHLQSSTIQIIYVSNICGYCAWWACVYKIYSLIRAITHFTNCGCHNLCSLTETIRPARYTDWWLHCVGRSCIELSNRRFNDMWWHWRELIQCTKCWPHQCNEHISMQR